ncbi:hypothetical protein CYMTET_21177 [Cymbomonas tetramitiformis]|uniref:Activator of Hsp90 ATPase AHSA1-like N-terminal domain-containing protein n=1 Tax=Cymbomonas tetramitiformis TaxID=36881 RepID=A0AAE0L3I2_9CHLO|nr:hypothetical protein CYMTET_21177 [Cymbomonas tetramitiformis]
MAKWGEGDSRWLVSDRQDGTNVNGWHWTEKNMMTWSKEKIAELFIGLPAEIAPAEGHAAISSVKEVKGDASLSTRKGNKKVAVYDLNIVLCWEGRVVGEDKKHTGEIKIKEFSSVNDEDEYEFSFTVEGKGKPNDKLKQAVKKTQPQLLEKLKTYCTEFNALCAQS